MQFPMVGSWSVRVTAVRPFTIHSDLYYEVSAARLDDGSDAEMVLRVPRHASKLPPEAGRAMKVVFLMGQVTSLEEAI